MMCIRFVMLAALLIVAGCASIPPEAPEVSAELGKLISKIEDSNIALLNRFFDQKRREVDRFIENEWIPEFAEQFFSDPVISDAWETIVNEDDKEQRLIFLIKAGTKLQEKINEKRLELIQPLDELETRIENRIRDNFTQARAINNSITSFLISASRVDENRSRYLEIFGVNDEKIVGIIDKTDQAIRELVGKAADIKDKVNKTEEYLKELRSIRESI